jgi:CheY-like chemotaxis protein
MNQQLLTFARRKVLHPEVANPNEIVAALGGFIRGAVGERVRVVTRLEPAVWPVLADRTQFEAAIVNLLVNARDALGGEGEVVIETRNEFVPEGVVLDAPSGDYVVTAVRDSGPGMPEEVVANAFDPFFTTKEVGQGTGLGLSQVYGLALGASGFARIASAPGEGAVVEILLPRTRGAAESAMKRIERPATQAREKVLVVEDDPAVLEMALCELTDLGYQVVSATMAREALDLLRGDPSIEVLYVVMPGGMNGAQLAVEARRLNPKLKFLLASGYAASALAKETGLAETAELLSKPYRREDLDRSLRLVISRG